MLGAIAFAAGAVLTLPPLRLAAKPLPALCLAAWVGIGEASRSRRLVAVGLALSALGDLQLELGGFLAGMAAFAAAHVAYVIAFLSLSRRPRLLLLLPYAAWGMGSDALLRPGLGALAVPVTVYGVLLTAMMWRAGACALESRARWPMAVGAVLFGLSDTLIALDRFRSPLPGAGFWIMALYWAGQWGIAAGSRGAQEPAVSTNARTASTPSSSSERKRTP